MVNPTVTSLSPSSGPLAGGTSVTIRCGLRPCGGEQHGEVRLGLVTPSSASATSLTVTSPAGSGMVDVTVTVGGQTSATSPADHFTYVAAPVVTSLSPASGPTSGGTSVIITETAREAGPVSFGGVAATGFTVNSATQITATTPAGVAAVLGNHPQPTVPPMHASTPTRRGRRVAASARPPVRTSRWNLGHHHRDQLHRRQRGQAGGVAAKIGFTDLGRPMRRRPRRRAWRVRVQRTGDPPPAARRRRWPLHLRAGADGDER